VIPEIADRLSDLKIQMLVEGEGHYVFARDACVALVGRTAAGFGSIGSTGLMTDTGLAYLVWREGEARLSGKGSEAAAAPEQVEAIRRFSEDLRTALGL
jgi:hypothetical protein